jgi:hypothetical protein
LCKLAGNLKYFPSHYNSLPLEIGCSDLSNYSSLSALSCHQKRFLARIAASPPLGGVRMNFPSHENAKGTEMGQMGQGVKSTLLFLSWTHPLQLGAPGLSAAAGSGPAANGQRAAREGRGGAEAARLNLRLEEGALLV